MKKLIAAVLIIVSLSSCAGLRSLYENRATFSPPPTALTKEKEEGEIFESESGESFLQKKVEEGEAQREYAKEIIELCELLEIGPFLSAGEIEADKLVAFVILFPGSEIKKNEGGAIISVSYEEVKKGIEKVFGIEGFSPLEKSGFYNKESGNFEIVATGLGDDIDVACEFFENDGYLLANADITYDGRRYEFFYTFVKTESGGITLYSKESAFPGSPYLEKSVEV